MFLIENVFMNQGQLSFIASARTLSIPLHPIAWPFTPCLSRHSNPNPWCDRDNVLQWVMYFLSSLQIRVWPRVWRLQGPLPEEAAAGPEETGDGGTEDIPAQPPRVEVQHTADKHGAGGKVRGRWGHILFLSKSSQWFPEKITIMWICTLSFPWNSSNWILTYDSKSTLKVRSKYSLSEHKHWPPNTNVNKRVGQKEYK